MPLIPLAVLELDAWPSARLSRLGVCFLCFAAPHAATYLIEMEQDGRLDQMRLGGRRPMRPAATAMFFVAAPWLLLGLVLTTAAIVAGRPVSEFGETVVDPRSFRTIAGISAVAGFATMLAALSTTVPFARGRLDPRIGVAALSVFAFAVCLAGVNIISGFRVSASGFVFSVLAEAAVIAVCIWRLPRRIAHPPTHGSARSTRFRLPPSEWILRWPGIYRGALLSSSGFALFVLFAPIGMVVRILAGNPQAVAAPALYLPPLFVGLIAVSLICREDAISGRLDLVRQSSRSVAVAAVEMLIGLWAPFAAATVALMAMSAILFDLTAAGLRFAVFAFLIMAPLPLIEGWSRLWPMMLMLPITAAIGFLSVGDSWLAIGALSAITWIAAGRMLQQPERATLSGWPGIVAMAAMCVVTMLPAEFDGSQIVALGTVTMMMPLSPLLIDPTSASHRWGQPLAIVITVLLMATIRHGAQAAVIAAVSVVAAWFASYRVREWEPSRPMVQAAIRVAVMVLLAQVAAAAFNTAPGRMVQWLASFGVLTVAIGLVALVEAGFRIATAIARRRAG